PGVHLVGGDDLGAGGGVGGVVVPGRAAGVGLDEHSRSGARRRDHAGHVGRHQRDAALTGPVLAEHTYGHGHGGSVLPFRDHLDRAGRTLGGAQAAALAVLEVDLEVGPAELADGVVGADAVAVVALEAVAAGQAA